MFEKLVIRSDKVGTIVWELPPILVDMMTRQEELVVQELGKEAGQQLTASTIKCLEDLLLRFHHLMTGAVIGGRSNEHLEAISTTIAATAEVLEASLHGESDG